VNPAGSTSISVRVGTHASFFESLRRRLSSQDYPQLAALKARETSDPSIAMLDAWAAAGDVLTFYNERFINEGFLRTATERRSLAELSDLIGYRPGPGVASSVYLAFTLEKDPKQASEETLIPKGTAVKSVPSNGEMPQTFETKEDLIGRSEWNAIKPRLEVPLKVTPANLQQIDSLYLSGQQRKIQPLDQIFVFPRERQAPEELTITGVEIDSKADRTKLLLRESPLSRLAIFREVQQACRSFLGRISDPIPSSLQTLRDKINELFTGNNSGFEPLTITTALAATDTKVSVVVSQSLLLKSIETLAELKPITPSAPPSYLNLSESVRKIVETDAKTWISAFTLNFEELGRFQSIFDKLKTIVASITAFTQTQIDAAISECEKAGKVPDSNTFPKHQAILTTLFGEINTLTPVGAHATYNAALVEFNKWLQGTTASQVSALLSLSTAISKFSGFVDLSSKVGFPFQGLVSNAADCVNTIITAIATISPTTQVGIRLTEVRDVLDAVIDLPTHVASLETIRTTVTFPTGSVTLLVDDFVAMFKTEKAAWDSAATDLKKHEKAVNAAKTAAQLFEIFCTVAEGIRDNITDTASDSRSLYNAIQKRRNAFIAAFFKIANAYDDLKNNTAPNARAAAQRLQKLSESLTAAVDLKGSSDLLLIKLPLSQAGAIPDFEAIASPNQSEIEQRIAALAEQLRNSWQVIAEPGQSGLEDPTDGGFEIGGITQVKGSREATQSGTQFVRLAKEVLEIPAKAASDIIPQIIEAMRLRTGSDLLTAWKRVRVPSEKHRVSLVRGTNSLFGHNAPRPIFNKDLELITDPATIAKGEWPWVASKIDYEGRVNLAQEQTSLPPWGSFYLRYSDSTLRRFDYSEQKTISRSDYGLNSKVTVLTIANASNWLQNPSDTTIGQLRTTAAIIESDFFELAAIPINQPLGNVQKAKKVAVNGFEVEEANQIELDGLYLGLTNQQQLVIQGELDEAEGVIRSEIAEVLFVRHIMRDTPGDTVHTRLFLIRPLANAYKRETVTIYANVVSATHGETVNQVLGSGDASQAFQSMPLAKGPLTNLAAPSPSGIESTLLLRVNNLLWHERESLLDSGKSDRDFIVQADEAWRSSVQFGDGETGARLPTGRENVRAEYRIGLGAAGNVKAGSITQLAGNKPLGLKEVINPLPATGGADPENADQIRGNAPLAVMALDRLVSVRDFADFARNYSAIDKAVAKRFSVGGQPTVHVTIAGTGDIPIADDSDLSANLKQAFRKLGDPLQVVRIDPRELLLIFLSVRVHIAADYEWSSVESAVRVRLYETFSFARRELAQAVYLSEVHSAIQSVLGVAYVDVEVFASLEQKKFQDALSGTESLDSVFESLRTPDAIPDSHIFVKSSRLENGDIRPAQIAILSPDVPDSLFITEIK